MHASSFQVNNYHQALNESCSESMHTEKAENRPRLNTDLQLYDMSLYGNNLSSISLYDGGQVSVLEAVAKCFCWFSEHPGVSKEALSDSLLLQHEMLPKYNRLPKTCCCV